MQASSSLPPITRSVGKSMSYFARPARILRDYRREYIQHDLIAGVTIGIILLPQALTFAVMAGLPPQMGIYAAIVASIVGALWGSSSHLHTGPTNTSSLLVLATVLPVAALGSELYIVAAGLLTVMVGVLRMGMGLLRLGLLVSFVSDAVVVGFTAGAGVLIIVNQLRTLMRLNFPDSSELIDTAINIAASIQETHLLSVALGLLTIILIILIQRIDRRLPAPILVIAVIAVAVNVFNLEDFGVATIGNIAGGLPPFTPLPIFDFDLIGKLSTGALAVAAIGLVEATSIGRSIASQSGQRVDSNQEFVGQGMANIVAGFFSGYVCSGSFNRSSANYQSGGRTAVAASFAGVFVLVISTIFAPFVASVPRAALAGLLMYYAFSMVDLKEIKRIWRSTRAETVILFATFVSTLLLSLQFAILTGILLSLAYYLLRTSTPRVLSVLPDDRFVHLLHQPEKPQCPQLAVMEVRGDLYFGAVNHVEDSILENMTQHPGQNFLLLRMQNVQQLDISGIHMLESVVKKFREVGGDVFMVKLRERVEEFIRMTGLEQKLGTDHFLEEDDAISHMFYRVLDPAICIYECEVRAFKECQNLPKPDFSMPIRSLGGAALGAFPTINAIDLQTALHAPNPPVVIDVREAREFRQGHIPAAINISLSRLLTEPPDLAFDAPVVLACRTGRRSQRAAAILRNRGLADIRILRGGMQTWEAAGYLNAVHEFV